jgi:hypothetical protein
VEATTDEDEFIQVGDPAEMFKTKPCKPFLKTNPCYPFPTNAHHRTDATESLIPHRQIAIVYKTNSHQRLT